MNDQVQFVCRFKIEAEDGDIRLVNAIFDFIKRRFIKPGFSKRIPDLKRKKSGTSKNLRYIFF